MDDLMVRVETGYCAACAITLPAELMEFRRHYGGFYQCADKIACMLRSHLDMCQLITSRSGRPNRLCRFCMAGTVTRPNFIIRDGRKLYAPVFASTR